MLFGAYTTILLNTLPRLAELDTVSDPKLSAGVWDA